MATAGEEEGGVEGQIEALGSAIRIALTDRQVEQLSELARLLVRWNERMNLTGHGSASEVVSGLIADALALSTELPAAPRSLADLGSGAGFPGLPLAILHPQSACVLVEARERRVHFQREAIRRLRLENTRALVGRAEALEPVPSAVVTAQAVAAPSKVVALADGWLEPGGVLAIPSSERVATETLGPPNGAGPERGGSGDPAEAELANWELRRYVVPGRSEPRALLLMRGSNS